MDYLPNTYIADLIHTKDLSKTTIEECHAQGICQIKDIEKFRNLNGFLTRLPYQLTVIAQSELKNLNQKLTLFNGIKHPDKFFELMSHRAETACHNAGIKNLQDLITFKTNGNQFEKITNCGTKTVTELENLYKKIIKYYREDKLDDLKHKTITERLENNRLKYIVNEFENRFELLSNGAKHAIDKLNKDNLKTIDLIDIIIEPLTDFSRIPGVGKKKLNELIKFRSDISLLVNELNNDNFNYIHLVLQEIEKFFPLNPKMKDELYDQIHRNQVDLIWFFDNLFSQNRDLLSLRESHIFAIILSESSPLREKSRIQLADLFKITPERARQIKKEAETNIFAFISKFKVLIEYTEFNPKNWSNYKSLDSYSELHPIQTRYIANDGSTLANILKHFYSESEYVYTSNYIENSNTEFSGSSSYLISNDFLPRPLFDSVIKDIQNKLAGKIEFDYEYNLKEEYPDLNDDQLSFLSLIITNDFSIELKNGCIEFKNNSFVKLSDLIVKYLEGKNEPQELEEIYSGILFQFGRTSKSVESLRGTINSNDEFTYFRGGGNTKYGLSKWVNEFDLKDGSVTELIIEYLDQFDIPVHYFEIFKHVKEYRDITRSNIYALIQMNASDKFIMFDGGFIGLNSKKYDDDYLNLLHEIAPSYSKVVFRYIQEKGSVDTRMVINLFSQKFNLFPVQIEYLLYLRQEKGEVEFIDQKVYIIDEEKAPSSVKSSQVNEEQELIINENHENEEIQKLSHEELLEKVLNSLQYEIKYNGNNPYTLSFRGAHAEIFVLNISSAYFKNNDVTRIQVPKHKDFSDNNLNNLVIPIGYDSENKVYVIWDPYDLAARLNNKDNISLYSKISVQEKAASNYFIRTINKEGKHYIAFREEILPNILFQIEIFFKISKLNPVLIGELLNTDQIRNRYLPNSYNNLNWYRNFCVYAGQWFLFHQFNTEKEYIEFLDTGELIVRMNNTSIKKQLLKDVITQKVLFFISKNFNSSRSSNLSWEFLGETINVDDPTITTIENSNILTRWKPQILTKCILISNSTERKEDDNSIELEDITLISTEPEMSEETFLDTSFSVEDIRSGIINILQENPPLRRLEITKQLSWQGIRLQTKQLGKFLYRHMQDILDKDKSDRWYISSMNSVSNQSINNINSEISRDNRMKKENTHNPINLIQIRELKQKSRLLAIEAFIKMMEQSGEVCSLKEAANAIDALN